MLLENRAEFAILVVDDNDSNRELLYRHLLRHGYGKILLSEGGRQALEMISHQPVDLVMLDIQMPDLNGYEVLHYLKSYDHLAKIPVIMISAVDDIHSVVRCIELGADDYLAKPFNHVLLEARVSACLERKRLEDYNQWQKKELAEANQRFSIANHKLEEINHQLSETNRILQQERRELEEANHKLGQIANLDGLTGIPNRRYFDQVLARELLLSWQNREHFSLIMFDIDYFKQFNDTYGHLAGDDCLRRVAKLTNQTVHRPRDQVARYGGEEFVVVLPGTGGSGAVAIAEKIRLGIQNLQIPHSGSKVSNYVTVSLGVHTLCLTEPVSADQMISTADQALYLSKLSRNSTTLIPADAD
ncbi:MAG: diguanylate cyclase [Pseudanabaenaceae cyanobacterium bins.68]|nr:diguanylate cyclase [Pseudanabaenaceae cyanobacterium bins.68]